MDATSVVRSMSDPVHLSVDGTLRNPYVAVAVAITVACVAVISYLGAKCWMRGDLRLTLVLFASMVGLWAVSHDLYQLLAVALQAIIARRIMSVTFFGSPPPWIIPVASAVATTLFFMLQRKRGLP